MGAKKGKVIPLRYRKGKAPLDPPTGLPKIEDKLEELQKKIGRIKEGHRESMKKWNKD
jgi:hypothetical protein